MRRERRLIYNHWKEGSRAKPDRATLPTRTYVPTRTNVGENQALNLVSMRFGHIGEIIGVVLESLKCKSDTAHPHRFLYHTTGSGHERAACEEPVFHGLLAAP